MHVVIAYKGPYLVRQAMDLELAAAVLQQAGHRVTLVHDPDTFGPTDNVLRWPRLAARLTSVDATARRVLAAAPRMVLLSVLPPTFGWAAQLAAALKAAGPVPVAVCGLHPTLAPARVMQEPAVDYLLRGELERALPQLVQAVAGELELAQVGSLWYRRGGQLRQTPLAALADLDRLPLPDKELFSPGVDHSYSYGAMVSRGCVNHCTFCEEGCLKAVHGAGYFRRRGVDAVMRELTTGLARYDFREVIFKDSYLSGDEDWLAELMQRYRQQINRPFKCFSHIQGLTARGVSLLKQGGCYCVEFGLQTWDEPLRRQVLGRQETNAEARRAFQLCADAGMWFDVDQLLNLPGEREEQHRHGALRYGELQRLNRVKVHQLYYLPGAAVVQHGVAAGDLDADAHRQLAEGREDFLFHRQPPTPQASDHQLAGWSTLFKLLPGLPRPLLRWLLQPGPRRVRALGLLPAPAVAALQGLLALRSQDLRFAAYLRSYPARVARTLGRALAHRLSELAGDRPG